MRGVIVTGNLGYLGPVVVKKLRENGHAVCGVDPAYFPSAIPYDSLADYQVSGVDAIPRAFWEPLAVVHLGAISNDPMGDLDPRMTYRTNTHMVADLVENFSDSKHVLASSASVYGNIEDTAAESTKLNPLTVYADSKAKAERLVDMINPNSAILRLATLWGAAPNFRTDLAINHFAVEAVVNGYISPTSNSKRAILHVEDAADSIVRAATGRRDEYIGVFNVLGQNIEVFEAAHKVSEAFGVGADLNEEVADADKRSYFVGTFRENHLVPAQAITLDNEKAMAELKQAAIANAEKPGRVVQLKQLLDAAAARQ